MCSPTGNEVVSTRRETEQVGSAWSGRELSAMGLTSSEDRQLEMAGGTPPDGASIPSPAAQNAQAGSPHALKGGPMLPLPPQPSYSHVFAGE
jgi:hypothetical protein